MTYQNTMLDPDTRIFICPGEEEAPKSEDTGVYVLPERESNGDSELLEAVQELLERTRLIEAKTDWIVRKMMVEKKPQSRKKRYRRY